MTRQLGITLLGAAGLFLVGSFVLGALLSRMGDGVRAVSPDSLSPAGVRGTGNPRYVGSRSCAATGCHNGNEPAHVVGDEYGIWSSRDPHARAFAVLKEPRSRDIVRRWRGRDEEPAKETACLECHAPLSTFPHARVGPSGEELAEDGVSCESCHGGAEKWLDVHYTDDWRRLTPDEKEKKGFLPTRNLAFRVRLCADCHVGRPGAEVDHDLLAAGHPRLAFEYAAYHELLPRHWEEKSYGKDFTARAWEIGQVAVAQAATELLESHARAAGPSRNLQPEFSEYDCFACHHDLRAPSWRQERGYGGRTPGLPAWGTWSLPMTAALTKHGGLEPSISAPHDSVDGLSQLMLQPHLASGEVRDKAAAASAELKKWAVALQSAADPAAKDYKVLDKGRVRCLLLRLVQQPSGEDGSANWDQAAQTYLAVAALYQTLAELDSGYATPGRRAAVDRLREAVRFPSNPPDGPLESPRDFTPGRFREALRGIQRVFGN